MRSGERLGLSFRRWRQRRDQAVNPQCLDRRAFCTAAAAAALGPSLAGLSAGSAHAADSPQGEAAAAGGDLDRFHGFLESLFPQAAAHGIDRAHFAAIFANLAPDPAVAQATGRQSEFERPFSAYFTEAVAARRIEQGRQLAKQWQTPLADIAHRSGVPASILLAAWGMESDFGRDMGTKDIVRSLATLAFREPERPLFRDELIAALVILIKRGIPRAKMTGSWAGAMGGPQFLPSAYLAHAVSYSGAAAPDIWTNAADILASIAAFLKASGWQRAAPWGMEIGLPARFSYATLHGDFRQWAAAGLMRADGAALPAEGQATLFFPEGAAGPAFLLADNYWVIKTYNNSDAYALSFACLADRIAGAPGLTRAWPRSAKLWRRDEKAEIQRLLTQQGFYKGIIDGRFGPSSRDAIHAFQIATGAQPADGVGGVGLLEALRQRAGR
jgi:lytic murein transglycosylase